MAFIKNGDLESIQVIKEFTPNDEETQQALESIKQAAKNIDINSNKIESNIELE
jgi:hypothetical protein